MLKYEQHRLKSNKSVDFALAQTKTQTTPRQRNGKRIGKKEHTNLPQISTLKAASSFENKDPRRDITFIHINKMCLLKKQEKKK